jgi:hypothetical protein
MEKTYKAIKSSIGAYVLLRDGFIIDGIFDDPIEAYRVADSNCRKYLGEWNVRYIPDLNKWLHNSGVLKPTEDLELARAVRNLTRS